MQVVGRGTWGRAGGIRAVGGRGGRGGGDVQGSGWLQGSGRAGMYKALFHVEEGAVRRDLPAILWAGISKVLEEGPESGGCHGCGALRPRRGLGYCPVPSPQAAAAIVHGGEGRQADNTPSSSSDPGGWGAGGTE